MLGSIGLRMVCLLLLSLCARACLAEEFNYDFESIAPEGHFTSHFPPDGLVGVSFEGINFFVISRTYLFTNKAEVSPSDYLVHDRLNSGFALLFETPVRSLSLDIAVQTLLGVDPGGKVSVRGYQQERLLFEEQFVASGIYIFDSSFSKKGLSGLSRLDIDLINGERKSIAIDNLWFAPVPEPQTSFIAYTTILLTCGSRRGSRQS